MRSNEDGRANPQDSSATLFLPHLRERRGSDTTTGWSLSPELQHQITRRLRLIAITYSLAFFFADIFPSIVFGEWRDWARTTVLWLPTITSILAGVLVAVLASSSRLSWRAKVHVGLVFEVVGSWGIAFAQYLSFPPELRSEPHMLMVLSPSWVAIWILFYSIVVPAPPKKTIFALIASVAAPPTVLAYTFSVARVWDIIPPPMFAAHHILPYLIVGAMAFAGARVVYKLGTDVVRARELGSYRLVERLGRGGMGEVWKATHQLLARPAAIKFIRPEAIAGVSTTEAKAMLKRFEMEARATASLTSAHTVDIYDFGATEDGSFYYVMELLNGLDCDNLVRRFGPLPPARVVHLLAQVCESLDEAHGQGLIHRDVKPANIYVCRNGNRFDFVKVLDFGLVTQYRTPEHDATRLTLPNQAVGTPQFMPPEVALGKATDGRTDLYALGCVAYWIATGRPVFGGDSLYDVVSKHLHSEPEPPSAHAPGMPQELDALVLECLRKSPDERPASARELARRLRAIPLKDGWGDEQAETWWTEAGLA